VRRATVVWILAGVVLAIGTMGGCAERPHVTGMYLSNRLNADGSQYHGLVSVVRDHERFVVNWIDLQENNGQVVVVPIATGVGMVEGGVFAVSQYSLQAVGLMVYRIEDEGQRLIGRQAMARGDGAAYSETLTRLPEHALERLLRRDQSDPPRERPMRATSQLASNIAPARRR
jgi:hypothetical protein